MSRTAAGTRFSVRNFGTCLNFSSGTKAQVSSSAILSGNPSFSVCAWVNVYPGSQPTTQGGIYCERNSTSGNDILDFGISPGTARTLQFKYRDDANTNTQVTSTGTITPGRWQHVAWVKNGTTVTFYINGQSAGSASFSTTDTLTNSAVCMIGNDPRDGNSSMIGKIDDVQVYTTALSSTDIQAIYYTGDPVSLCKGYWKFDEGSGTTVFDATGLNGTGTITSATYSTDVKQVGRSAATGRVSV